MKRVRIAVVGLGTVGRWLLRALARSGDPIGSRYGLDLRVVAVASRGGGFAYRADGIDVASLIASADDPVTPGALAGVETWPTALEGLRATEADVLVEVSASPASDGAPGLGHLREALERGMPAVTSNKWPIALAGVELLELARTRSAVLRAEATVMSGTPVLRALGEGLAGARPESLRGILNATSNAILTTMATGAGYAEALAGARRDGLAERDPAADVDGYDSVAKLMILAALVFGRRLRLDDVQRRGISSIDPDEQARAVAEGHTIRELSTLEPSGGDDGALIGRVAPVALPESDLLARVNGTDNAIVCRADPLGEVTVIGPGAGPDLAGQGVLSDLIDVAQTVD